ncbi:MAG: S24/S26 family peptidase [Candidatus Howiella sp.]|jgi:signal peptidase
MGLSLEALAPVMAEMLRAGREVTFLPEGESMLPLLPPGRCKVVLTRPITPPRKHDILFYRRENGVFLLHRVVSVEEDGCIMCGDNQYYLETGLKPENIIGRMKGFYRDGVYNGLNTPGYHIYCRMLWTRRIWLKIRARIAAKRRQSE